MNDAELQNLTKRDFAYKLRSINTGLPCELFVVAKLRSVFHVMLDRIYPSNCADKDQVLLRNWALYKWANGPGWYESKIRALDFQFPNDNLDLLKASNLWCEIKGVAYRLPQLAKKLFTERVPNAAAFIKSFRQYNSNNAESITVDIAKEGFRLYVHSYFPCADSSTTRRLLHQFSQCIDVQQGASKRLSSDVSPLDPGAKETSPIVQRRGTACSTDNIKYFSPESKKHLVRRKGNVRKVICPRPKLRDLNVKSQVTHLHLGSFSTNTVIDVEAIPSHNASIAIVFRNKAHRRKLFYHLNSIEVIIDGDLTWAQIQEVKTMEDFETTDWFLSVDSMNMVELKALLQQFFGNRSSLPASMFCSDEFHVLSDGGLFIDCDSLPLSLRKYYSKYLVSNIGVKKAIGAEPSAGCRICNPLARGTKRNGPNEQELEEELEIPQKDLLSNSPEDVLNDGVRNSSLPAYRLPSKPMDNLEHSIVDSLSSTTCQTFQKPHHADADSQYRLIDHESSTKANTKEMPLSISTSENGHATSNPKTHKSSRKKRGKRKPKRQESSEHDIPLKKRLRANCKHLETSEPSNHTTQPDSMSSAERDMLSALDAYLEQAQARLRAEGRSFSGDRT